MLSVQWGTVTGSREVWPVKPFVGTNGGGKTTKKPEGKPQWESNASLGSGVFSLWQDPWGRKVRAPVEGARGAEAEVHFENLEKSRGYKKKKKGSHPLDEHAGKAWGTVNNGLSMIRIQIKWQQWILGSMGGVVCVGKKGKKSNKVPERTGGSGLWRSCWGRIRHLRSLLGEKGTAKSGNHFGNQCPVIVEEKV